MREKPELNQTAVWFWNEGKTGMASLTSAAPSLAQVMCYLIHHLKKKKKEKEEILQEKKMDVFLLI